VERRLPPIAGLLILPLLLLLSYGNQFLYLSGAEFSDLTISHLSNAMFLKRALLEWGQIPLWSPGILSGFPFAANPLSGLFYPPGWLAVMWPEAWIFNLLAGLHLVWGGVGMFFLLRKEGVGTIAAVFAGLAFSLMPKLIAHYGAGHITLVYAVSWTPWLLYVSQIMHHRPRQKYWPAVILALIFFADVRWAVFAGLLWMAWWFLKSDIAAYSHETLVENLQFVLLFFIVQLVLAAALSAPLGLPLAELVGLSTRASLSAEDVLAFSLPPARLLGLLFPEFGGMQEWVVYPGVTALVLALVGLVWSDVRRKMRFWWGVWLVSGLFSLGEYIPGLSLLAKLPGVSLLRVPSRAMFLAGMTLAVLAAFSLDHLLSGISAGERRRGARVLVILFGVASTMAIGVWSITGDMPINFMWGAGMAGLTLMGLGWMLGSRRTYPPWAGFLLIGIGLLDWGGVGARSLSPRTAAEIFLEKAEVADFLAAQDGQFRVYSPSYSLPQHIAAKAGLELADGVDPLQVASYVAFMARASGVPQDGYSVTVPPFAGEVESANAEYMPDAALLGWLNVRFVISEFDLKGDGWVLMKRFGETRVYENGAALGRAWVQDVEDPPGWEAKKYEELKWSPNRIEVIASGSGLLVLSEVVYPGWQVRVDGHRADLVVVDGVLRGVDLPPGSHRVVFDFHPVSLYVGLGLFAMAVVFLVVSTMKLKQDQE
jgi:hypothetical protein